jgi:hypothetical protein
MYRTAVILAALLCFAAASPGKESGENVTLEVQAEYRRDTIDYDDREKSFTREKVGCAFGESSASITHVYISEDNEHRFTGSLALRGISPYVDCIAGHYYANFGAGLIAGKKTYASPDPFTRSLIVSRGDPFTPCTGGNPLYCFQGVAAGFIIPAESFTLSVRGFFSYRDRFVRNDNYLPGVTGTSFTSILARAVRDYRYAEPVEISDYGCVIDLRVADRLLLQAYFLYAGIRRSTGSPLLWNYGDRGLLLGEKAFYAYGFFAQYRDDYISLFMEIGIPSRVMSTVSGRRGTIRDYGLLYGVTFTHEACALTFSGKNCGRNFYAPYGAGTAYAESAWLVGLAVRPRRFVTLHGSFYAEKKLSSASALSYLPFLKRERLRVKYAVPRKASCSFQVTALQDEKKNRAEHSLQVKVSAAVYIMESILLTASGTARREEGNAWSGSVRARMSLCLLRYFSLSFSYSRFFVFRGDPLYAPRPSGSDSISTGRYIDESSHVISCRLSARYRDFRFSASYQHRFTGDRTLEQRLELSGTILL